MFILNLLNLLNLGHDVTAQALKGSVLKGNFDCRFCEWDMRAMDVCDCVRLRDSNVSTRTFVRACTRMGVR